MRERIVGAYPLGQQRSVGIEPLERQQGQQVPRVLLTLEQQTLVRDRPLLLDGAVFYPAFRCDDGARLSLRLRRPELLVCLSSRFLEHGIRVLTCSVND